jgi:lantibiotic modifying enzyme
MATDAHFCHGASGLAHFYKVIYAHTGDERHHQAASYWIGETLRYLNTELKNDYYKNKETDLLNGLPGISLVLLSFTAEKELAWGRAFLL